MASEIKEISRGFKMGGGTVVVLIVLGVGGYLGWQNWGGDWWQDRQKEVEVAKEEPREENLAEVVDAEQVDEPEEETAEEVAVAEPAPQGKYTVTVYYANDEKDAEESGDSVHVYGIDRYTNEDGVGSFGLGQLIAGPAGSELTQGYYTAFKVLDWEPGDESPVSLSINNSTKTATVNFSKDLEFSTEANKEKAKMQIQNTLVQFPTIDAVVIKVNGEVPDWAQ